MTMTIEEEFRKMQENMNKEIEIVLEGYKGEYDPKKGILIEFFPYTGMDIKPVSSLPGYDESYGFFDVSAGIKLIRDSEGEEIYRNDNLDYKKRFYSPFIDPEDNKHFNKMRKAKFGPDHDIKIVD